MQWSKWVCNESEKLLRDMVLMEEEACLDLEGTLDNSRRPKEREKWETYAAVP